MVYLLNHSYASFYKWMHRGMKELKVLPDTVALFEQLAGIETDTQHKQKIIEKICRSAGEKP